MADIRQVITHWSTANAQSGLSVMYFRASTSSIGAQRIALAALWGDVDAFLTDDTTWTIATSGDVLEETTGVLTGTWSDSTAFTSTGGSATDSVPNASQLLIRWNTGQIIAGRRLQGRTFVPGFADSVVSDGQVSGTAQTSIGVAVESFGSADNGFGIWHRPKLGAGGLHVSASGGSVWNEFAVQRRRR